MICNQERNDQSQKHIVQCNVSHSSNTVPAVSCVPPSTYEANSDLRRVNASKCGYKTSYKITTFIINDVDSDKQLACTVRYTAVGNSSVVYSEKKFVPFPDSVKARSNKDSLDKGIIPSGESGRLSRYNYVLD